jgi:multiple sugar transport system substrate-binding protein
MFFPNRKWLASLFLSVLCVVILAGCSSGSQPSQSASNQGDANPAKAAEPVTLKIAIVDGWFTDEQFQAYFVNPVRAKYPNITFELVPYIYAESSKSNPALTNMTNLVAKGIVPDIIATSSLTASDLINLGLENDMDSLIKKHNLDLNSFEKGIIDAVKVASSDGKKITMLPYERNFSALYYNKDIFDKFGVSYPPDGMTWDEAAELAKKVTRKEGGTQYRGLEPNLVFRAASALSLGFVDPATKKAIVNNDGWKKVFTTLKSIYDIPGNSEFQASGKAVTAFSKDKTLAMFVGLGGDMEKLGMTKELNWDMATYPSFEKNKQISFNFDAHVLAVTSGSKHKDEAFQVVASLISKATQTLLAQNGNLPVIKDDSIIKAFGSKLTYLQGKHVEAIFKTTPATPPQATVYDAEAKMIMNQAMQSVVKGEIDVNTALRQSEEKVNQLVQK